jgi:flagellar biosynthesis/type III secretory pathway protein FliH
MTETHNRYVRVYQLGRSEGYSEGYAKGYQHGMTAASDAGQTKPSPQSERDFMLEMRNLRTHAEEWTE